MWLPHMSFHLKNCMKKVTGGVIFDIDNTLVPHGAPADDRARKAV